MFFDGQPPPADQNPGPSTGLWLGIIAAVAAVVGPLGAWVSGLIRSNREFAMTRLAADRKESADKEKAASEGWREIAANATARSEKIEQELREHKVLIGRLIEWAKGMQMACENADPPITYRPWSDVVYPGDPSAIHKAITGGS